MLYGYSDVILRGTLVTLELALLLGLIGAGAKLSRNQPLAMIFEGYTTLIRGVPDLVLMLLNLLRFADRAQPDYRCAGDGLV